MRHEKMNCLSNNLSIIKILAQLNQTDKPYRKEIKIYLIMQKPSWILMNKYSWWLYGRPEYRYLGN